MAATLIAQQHYDLNAVGNDRLPTPHDPRSMMASQIFATTPNGTAVLSPNTPMEDVNDVSLLSFLEVPRVPLSRLQECQVPFE